MYAQLQKKENAATKKIIQRQKGDINVNGKLSGFSKLRENDATKFNHRDNLKTDVSFGAERTLNTNEKVGKSMMGIIGPDHPQGSSPDQAVATNFIKAANNKYKKRHVRGHLLNDNIGGPGKHLNLYPISDAANRLHETRVESDLKTLVNTQKGYVHYSVKVEDINEGDAAANFVCEWSPLDAAGAKTLWKKKCQITTTKGTAIANDIVRSALQNQNLMATEGAVNDVNIEKAPGAELPELTQAASMQLDAFYFSEEPEIEGKLEEAIDKNFGEGMSTHVQEYTTKGLDWKTVPNGVNKGVWSKLINSFNTVFT